MTQSTVKLGLVQLSCTANAEENLEKTIQQIRLAAEQGAQIICTQELFQTLYFCQTEAYEPFSLAESIPGKNTDRLATLAKELGVVIVASLFEKRAQGLYHNTAAVLDADGTYLGKYRKMHIPDDPGFYEKFYFTPGDLGFKVFETKFAKIGVLICWDQWYPEAARLTALQGAQILFYPTAIGWSVTENDAATRTAQHQAWATIQKSHAIANGVFVAAVNRIGQEDDLKFWGQSFVANPFGVELAKASVEQAETLIVECDLSQIDFYRQHWPFLRDRRIEAFSPIAHRFID
ncbi:Nitrilase/cyanide hydratase and apolipoprotein N-acyltransferase [Chloroherpeton thalassium ATCC 35110]|uniref:Nitrilase/cyanide hydratase and apolipoprotein N-acyltransferase n=1 Tax=Chloroherpeton thalassium (strain ATCC 35110 / GB-78) TaxID=517418 RepID=B3QXD9_CHLT3|nr:carbon-nitrogen hydrolase [Chloroherpeton thalassium]ACF13413.1 Nitrilase/cyanide hydratase and apolipoprotein N-acyltransferase [Chloroherpeton thalassium ATCC 35110]